MYLKSDFVIICVTIPSSFTVVPLGGVSCEIFSPFSYKLNVTVESIVGCFQPLSVENVAKLKMRMLNLECD